MQGRHGAGSSCVRGGDSGLVSVVLTILEREGYRVVDYSDTKGCVDVVARGQKVLVVRVVSNVDGLRDESVAELVKTAVALGGAPVVVGERTKRGELEDDVVYRRYGVPVVSVNTFEELVRGNMPFVEEYKGRKIMFVDGEKMRNKREKKELSMSELARATSTTKETIYRCEHGFPAMESTVRRIEEVLGKVRAPVRLFDEHVHVDYREESKWTALSVKDAHVFVFTRTPWDAVFEKGVVALSEAKGNVRRKEELLVRGKGVVSGTVALVAERKIQASIPVLYQEEIREMECVKEILKRVRELDEKQ